jgi:hypothetical protein
MLNRNNSLSLFVSKEKERRAEETVMVPQTELLRLFENTRRSVFRQVLRNGPSMTLVSCLRVAPSFF